MYRCVQYVPIQLSKKSDLNRRKREPIFRLLLLYMHDSSTHNNEILSEKKTRAYVITNQQLSLPRNMVWGHRAASTVRTSDVRILTNKRMSTDQVVNEIKYLLFHYSSSQVRHGYTHSVVRTQRLHNSDCQTVEKGRCGIALPAGSFPVLHHVILH